MGLSPKTVLLALICALPPVWAKADSLPPTFPEENLVTERDSFVSADGTTEMPLVLNHVGVLLPEELEGQRALRTLAQQFNLEFTAIYEERLAFLRVSDDLAEREGLIELIREMRPAAREAGIQVGLAYADGGKGAVPSMTTDEIVVGSAEGDIEPFLSQLEDEGYKVLTRHPFLKAYAVVAASSDEEVDLMQAARDIIEKTGADYAYPNTTGLAWNTETLLNDPIFANQWHLRNTGQSSGTTDADADVPDAWDITLGAPGTVIAIHELGGFDTAHPDLTPNFWVNPGEVPGNNVDDDGNLLVDDTLGYDFGGCTAATWPGCGDNQPVPDDASQNHGTAVAGVAAARGNNALGVTGSCPQCGLMLLKSNATVNDFARSLPFGYAQAQGAAVISNSWSSSQLYPLTTAAINAAANAGLSVLFASGNTSGNNCGDPRVSNANVMAVSSSSNQDQKVIWSSIGNCIDILSPSHRGYFATDPYTGTLNVTTTDRQGAAGYNNNSPVNNCPTAEAAPPPANARDYTACFGGTSSAAPLTAGVVGLIESVNNTITRTQIQALLSDTADRIEDGAGAYSDVNGFSAASPTPTHSWGRMNAFEAVRIAAPVAQGGKGGVDVFIRDNRLDWGNTINPSNTLYDATRGFIPHWRSVDIKVDAPPHGIAPVTSAQFDAFVDEDPIESSVNRVYVRVRNRGPVTAESVTVKLHWAFAGTALPALPSDFWTAFPTDSSDTSIWHPTPPQTITNLAYSGSTVAGAGGDAAQILTFDFDAPEVDPRVPAPRHYCVMVVLDSPQDEITENTLVVDVATPRNNNMTHRNLSLQDSTDDDGFSDFVMVRNPFKESIRSILIADAPDGWKVDTGKIELGRPFSLQPGEEVAVPVIAVPGEHGATGEVSLVQYDVTRKEPQVIGGFDIAFKPSRPNMKVEITPEILHRLEDLVPRLERELGRLEVILPRLEDKMQ